MKRVRSRTDTATAEILADPGSHGGYWNDAGQWIRTGNFEDYNFAPQGSMTRFVRRLVWLRRNSDLMPKQAVDYIVDHKREAAFPNHKAWDRADDWRDCPCSTSVEVAVKLAGGAPARMTSVAPKLLAPPPEPPPMELF